MTGILITEAAGDADMAEVRSLLSEYALDLGARLSVHDIADDIARLPGRFAPPRGLLLLARTEGAGPQTAALGCVGLRPLPGPGDCEVTRLYVRGGGRGIGLGQWLGREMIARARAMGYRRVLLESHDSMDVAGRIYAEMGFRPIPPYYANPLPGTIYMALDLAADAG